MKRGILVLALIVVGMSAAQASHALKWHANTVLKVMPRPVGADDFLVKATGIHRAIISSYTVADRVFPIRIRLDLGELLHNGFPIKGCGTDWVWATSTLSLTCTTRYTQRPCEDGLWDASTRARLEGHPSGGTRHAVADRPVYIDCACL